MALLLAMCRGDVVTSACGCITHIDREMLLVAVSLDRSELLMLSAVW
jgi:hypothetical protein